ncbi:hypothetical protein DASC09_030340 [Saccharomycopsis crataegensis]|uniref:Uncharacterized protein n=1 Tax=Saccharomycopsis crataegensis TaxID=43959 RepID=A0AAV5QLV0_9ASCO|nr:hypothetical protein DASC09_030340 [Saccharomycopsis crataegensis]
MELFIVSLVFMAAIFLTRETYIKKEFNERYNQLEHHKGAVIDTRLKPYKEQIETLNSLAEKSSSMLKLKNSEILKLTTELQAKKDKIEQLNNVIVQGYGKVGVENVEGLQALTSVIDDLKEANNDSKIMNNKLAFNCILKKQENKTLVHDIQLYVDENKRLEEIIKNLLVTVSSTKSQMESIQMIMNSFEKEWLYLLESSKNEINLLKKSILKRHLEVSNKLSEEKLVNQTKAFVAKQLQLNQEIDMKNQQLTKLKDCFFQSLKQKNNEIKDLLGDHEKNHKLKLPLTKSNSTSPQFQPSMFHPSYSQFNEKSQIERLQSSSSRRTSSTLVPSINSSIRV